MLNQYFLQGDYQRTIAQATDSLIHLKHNEIPGLIGAYCFTGNLLEAKKVYKDSYQFLSESEKAACRFFLGLLYTRKSQYDKAFKIFYRNYKSLKPKANHLQQFYVYQGNAFYYFFLGKFRLSLKWAKKSFDAAVDAKDLYARSLSTDLLAHNKLRLGEINIGLELLKKAENISQLMGNKSVSSAISSAELQYRAHYGYERKYIINILVNRFEDLVSEDNYSRAAIGLELSRQYTLRGQFDKAETILEKITSNIFSTENRRQEIQLNLRFAENYYLCGKKAQAWNYVRAARRCLNYEVDKSFELQICGFELKLFNEETASDLKAQLVTKMRDFNTIVNHNILSRQKMIKETLFNREDLFHDFLISLENENKPIDTIIESGYLSLLPEILGFKYGETGLYLDIENNTVILFLEKKIEVLKEKFTPLDMKLLISLASGVSNKSEMIQQVWEYEYDPLRHDNVIYTAIRSLRRALGEAGGWIETIDSGYRYSIDRKFKISKKISNKENLIPNHELLNSIKLGTDTLLSPLNYRQLKALDHIKTAEYLDVLTYQKKFSVSEATASRDLRHLKKCGFVISIGKARATKYLLANT